MLPVLTVHLTLICIFFDSAAICWASSRLGLWVKQCKTWPAFARIADCTGLVISAAWRSLAHILITERCWVGSDVVVTGRCFPQVVSQVIFKRRSPATIAVTLVDIDKKPLGKLMKLQGFGLLLPFSITCTSFGHARTCCILFCFQMSQAMNWSAEDCEKLQKARDETRLEKAFQKNSGYTGTTEQDMKNSEQHEVHCCSRFVMSVVQAIGSWLQAVWVMLAPRIAKLSGGLADTAARAFQSSKSSGLMLGISGIGWKKWWTWTGRSYSSKSYLCVRNLSHSFKVSNFFSCQVFSAHHWTLSDKNSAALRKVQLNRHGSFDVWTTLFIPPDIAHRM